MQRNVEPSAMFFPSIQFTYTQLHWKQ